MTWTLTTSEAAIRKAGENADATIVASGAALANWSDQAEGRIVAETRRNWVTDYASVPADVKKILDDTASSLIAMQIINYNMLGFTSRAEAQTMLNIQDNTATTGMRVLKDFKSNEIRGI